MLWMVLFLWYISSALNMFNMTHFLWYIHPLLPICSESFVLFLWYIYPLLPVCSEWPISFDIYNLCSQYVQYDPFPLIYPSFSPNMFWMALFLWYIWVVVCPEWWIISYDTIVTFFQNDSFDMIYPPQLFKITFSPLHFHLKFLQNDIFLSVLNCSEWPFPHDISVPNCLRIPNFIW